MEDEEAQLRQKGVPEGLRSTVKIDPSIQSNNNKKAKTNNDNNVASDSKSNKAFDWHKENDINQLIKTIVTPYPFPILQNTPEINHAIQLWRQGSNLFLTSSEAGSGNSTLMNIFITVSEQDMKQSILKISNNNMSGSQLTCLSYELFASTTLGIECNSRVNLDAIHQLHHHQNKHIVSLIINSDVLYIPEVSTLGQREFIHLYWLCCILRDNQTPFGGLQVIMSGDFHQLSTLTASKMGFIFEAQPEWNQTFPTSTIIHLHSKKFLSQPDELQSILHDLHTDVVWSNNSLGILNLCKTLKTKWDVMTEVQDELQIMYNSKQVIQINQLGFQQAIERLKPLPNRKPIVYEFKGWSRLTTSHNADDDVDDNDDDDEGGAAGMEVPLSSSSSSSSQLPKRTPRKTTIVKRLEYIAKDISSHSPVIPNLKLCEGVRVILITNYKNKLRRGQRGTVIGFTKNDKHYPIVTFDHNLSHVVIEPHKWCYKILGEGEVQWIQLPLILGYAITIPDLLGLYLDLDAKHKIALHLNTKDPTTEQGLYQTIFNRLIVRSAEKNLTELHQYLTLWSCKNTGWALSESIKTFISNLPTKMTDVD